MANNIAFQAMGNTVALVATAANTQSTVATLTANTPVQQYLLTNQDNLNVAFVQISATSTFNTALPTNTASQQVIPVLPFDQKVVTAIQVSATSNVYARVISVGTTTVYITPGEGL
jgi:hypothetical protein